MTKIHHLYNDGPRIPRRHNHYIMPCVFAHKEYIPIYPNRHNDKESGQNEFHYHVDTRFISRKNIICIRLSGDFEIHHKSFKCHRKKELASTSPNLVSQSKGVKNGYCKNLEFCPHKGFDLRGVSIDNGFKTCPLHGLKIQYDK